MFMFHFQHPARGMYKFADLGVVLAVDLLLLLEQIMELVTEKKLPIYGLLCCRLAVQLLVEERLWIVTQKKKITSQL